MALAITFSPGTTMGVSHYDEAIRRLEAAGLGSPQGRLYHLCFGDPSSLRVIDIWESEAAFGTFGQQLMPILAELGIDPGQPDISEVHNVIKG